MHPVHCAGLNRRQLLRPQLRLPFLPLLPCICHTRHPFVCPLLPAPGAFADCLVRIPFNLAFAFAARQLRFLSFSFFYFPLILFIFFFWRLFHNFNKVHWDFPGVQCAQSIVISSAISKYPTAIGDGDHRCSVCVDFHIFSLHFLFINTNGWHVCPPFPSPFPLPWHYTQPA